MDAEIEIEMHSKDFYIITKNQLKMLFCTTN